VFSVENLQGRDHLEDWRKWAANVRMGLREIRGWEDVDWLHQAQDRDQWCALVKTVMNRSVP
jgi:hypothetical protein